MLPKKCHERVNRLQKLANDGNFKHNTSVLSSGSGHVIVGRRSTTGEYNPVKYLQCKYCHKFITKNNMWRHQQTCQARDNESEGATACTKKCRGVTSCRWIFNSALFDVSETCLRELMNRMRDDRLKVIVLQDELIRKYASLRMKALHSKAVQKHNDVHRVSQSTRLMARLVDEERKQIPSITLDELVTPSHFDLVTKVARAMSTDKDEQSLNVGRSLGLVLSHVAKVKNGMALRAGDENRRLSASAFQQLYKAEWNFRVNSPAVKFMNAKKKEKTAYIPLNEDLQHLCSHIVQKIKQLMIKLHKVATPHNRTWLAKLVMSRLILFNKRRLAEIKYLKVKQYIDRLDWNTEDADEMELALSPVDRMLAKRLDLNCQT